MSGRVALRHAGAMPVTHLHYTCWACGADNVLHGTSEDCCDLVHGIPEEWECWNCDALNATP